MVDVSAFLHNNHKIELSKTSEASEDEELVEILSHIDSILEETIFKNLPNFIKTGGAPNEAVDMLKNSFVGFPSLINLIIEWLVELGDDKSSIDVAIRETFSLIFSENFKLEEADQMVAERSVTPDWLKNFLDYPEWRSFIYNQFKANPSSTMLRNAIKFLSTGTYCCELYSIAHLMTDDTEIFFSVLSKLIQKFITSRLMTETVTVRGHIAKMAECSFHSLLAIQMAIQSLIHKNGSLSDCLNRLCQFIYKTVSKQFCISGVYNIIDKLHCDDEPTLELFRRMAAVVERGYLVEADLIGFQVSSLTGGYYSAVVTPFIDILADDLFVQKFQFSEESFRELITLVFRFGELDMSDSFFDFYDCVTKTVEITQQSENSNELKKNLLFLKEKSLKYSFTALGVLRWVYSVVGKYNYFLLESEKPLHLFFVDEIVCLHPSLHHYVCSVLLELFEIHYEAVDVGNSQIKHRKTILDRILYLFFNGFVFKILSYFKSRVVAKDVDISLVRYFVNLVLDNIVPPYSDEFHSMLCHIMMHLDSTDRSTPAAKIFIEWNNKIV